MTTRPVAPRSDAIMAADLYGDLLYAEPAAPRGWRTYLPGLTIVTLGTLAAGFLADRYGAPLTLMSLLIGLALNFLSADARLTPGLTFASRSLLRWGIVLVGVRVTGAQVLALGPVALLCVIGILALAMGVGVLVSRRLGLGTAFGTLAGGAVAICGASAAMALATTLGEKRVSQAQLTLVLVGISAMSAGAMVLYPLLAHGLRFSDVQAGFLLGASIHDVAQALGAGYTFSGDAGQIAAIVKLTRVALLAPVLAIVAATLPRAERGKGVGIPWFVVGFFGLAGINSLGVIPSAVAGAAEQAAAALLAAAVTAIAIRSPLAQLLGTSGRPLAVIAAATLAALAAAALVAGLLL
jgi:uncharacterized integral membrane protein (TIGR00698 family)